MRGGISRTLRPAKASGIAPRLEPDRERQRLRPGPRPETGSGEVSALPGSGKAGRLQGLHRSSASMEARGPALSEGRPEEVSASMRAQGDGEASAEPDPAGREGRISIPPERPEGIGERPQSLSRDPRDPNAGHRPSLRDPGKAATASASPRSRSRPARDGRATQRRQSRLGQVGAGGDTGPHYRSGRCLIRFAVVA